MSELFVVRHGQARLFSGNYDRLSDLGMAQARALGRSWLKDGIRPDHVWCGTLERQIKTASIVGEVFSDKGARWPKSIEIEHLNEYPAEEILTSLGGHLKKTDPDIRSLANALDNALDSHDRYRHFQRYLEAVIARWVNRDYRGAEMPLSWADWSDNVRETFRRIMSSAGSGESVAVFTSGGPVGVSVQTALAAPDIKAAELNWRVNNCSITRFTFSGQRVSLDRFNEVAHLQESLLTYR